MFDKLLRKPQIVRLRRSCWAIIPIAIGILYWGFELQWSVSPDLQRPDQHLIRLAACLIFAIAGFLITSKTWRRHSYSLYFVCVVLLLLVLLIGRETNHSRRWIDLISGFKIQPSEFMKLALILALAKWFADHPRPRRFSDLLKPAMMCFVPAFLILIEPDLGTSLVFIPMFMSMVWMAGMPWKNFRWLVFLPVLLAPIASFVIQDYQKERVMTWWHQNELSPEEISAEGYHLWHSKLAVGSGGWQGYGWGQGPENRLGRLPERHNDFVFPVIAEESGFIGATLFLLLYSAFGLLLLFYASRHRCRFTRLVLAGVGVHFLSHMVINVGVTLGVWPTTGLPLPMISFGGSSMMISGAAIGIALSVGSNRAPLLTSA
ncbi:MAG: FtsW/RodA/SpoVE family cell cycle protein [Planctomycetes bacterium]|nr:FtsW/RodA/SpoVE family cell cycle protein [Planctomycetota bacterium]